MVIGLSADAAKPIIGRVKLICLRQMIGCATSRTETPHQRDLFLSDTSPKANRHRLGVTNVDTNTATSTALRLGSVNKRIGVLIPVQQQRLVRAQLNTTIATDASHRVQDRHKR